MPIQPNQPTHPPRALNTAPETLRPRKGHHLRGEGPLVHEVPDQHHARCLRVVGACEQEVLQLLQAAVHIANDSIFGLAGAVWSNNINTAHKVAAAVRVGTMGINNYFGGDITVPFGGFKQSGNGRDKSMHAFDDYTELKTTWIELE